MLGYLSTALLPNYYQLPCTGFIQPSLNKIQGLFKDFLRLSYSFQGLKVYENS